MEEHPTVQRLINIVNDINPSNVHQAICSLYDIHNDITEDVLKQFGEHFKLSFLPSERPAEMTVNQFIIAALPYVMFLFNAERKEECSEFLIHVLEYISSQEIPRTFDRLSAKFYFFYSLSAEDPLPVLLAAYRKACDSHFHQTQATIANCILKRYIDIGGYSLALSFLKHCNFPSDASPAQLGRYHFFVGHLKAITLEYTLAQHHLQLSLRRAPQNKYSAQFRGLVTRHLMVVMMLQGQVPARSMLLETPVYLKLARSILQGDVISFQEVAQSPVFEEDGLAPLVQRLRSSVILAGLTMIAHCYSRISFNDIAEQLHIGSAEDAEGFCAKAAADGLIDAVIEHESGCLVSMKGKEDASAGFAERLNKDIQDCFGIREDTQRTMHEEAVTD